MPIMAIRVVEFSSGVVKLERFLPKHQHTQRKLLNFENWCKGQFNNYVDKIRGGGTVGYDST